MLFFLFQSAAFFSPHAVHKIAFIIIIQFECETAWLPGRHKWIWFNWINGAAMAKLGQSSERSRERCIVHTSGLVWWNSMFSTCCVFFFCFVPSLCGSSCLIFAAVSTLFRWTYDSQLTIDFSMHLTAFVEKCNNFGSIWLYGVQCKAHSFLMHNSFHMNNATLVVLLCVSKPYNSCYYYNIF